MDETMETLVGCVVKGLNDRSPLDFTPIHAALDDPPFDSREMRYIKRSLSGLLAPLFANEVHQVRIGIPVRLLRNLHSSIRYLLDRPVGLQELLALDWERCPDELIPPGLEDYKLGIWFFLEAILGSCENLGPMMEKGSAFMRWFDHDDEFFFLAVWWDHPIQRPLYVRPTRWIFSYATCNGRT